MPRSTRSGPPTVALRLECTDGPGAVPAVAARIAAAGGILRTLSTVRRRVGGPVPVSGPATGHGTGEPITKTRHTPASDTTPTVPVAVLEVEVEGLAEADALAALSGLPELAAEPHLTRTLDRVFGKRVIVIGGGAQVAQVALGAVSEADRHNLRGERISVDTIALVGEENLAAAVRAVADLPRARCLVLAGSIMGGDVTRAVRELQASGIPVIALNMAGSLTKAADLVVSDPVQAGTMAVMAVADTATFDLTRQRGRRY